MRVKGAYFQFWRLAAVAVAVLGAFGAVGWRLYDLQVVRRADLRQEALALRVRLQVLPAARGTIVDAKGNLLAAPRSTVDIGLDPQVANERTVSGIEELAALLGKPVEEVGRAVEQKFRRSVSAEGREVAVPIRWVRLAEGASESTFNAVMALKLPGVYGNRKFTRFYPHDRLGAHVVGFFNEGGFALGVEHAMDYYLRGQDGWREVEQNRWGRELPHFRAREVAPRAGFHVELTLDAVLQFYADQEMRRLASEFRPESIAILISEVGTGRLRALASFPDFDPNQYGKSPSGNFRNRVLTDVLEPGSTFKIVPMSSALELGLVTPETVYDCAKPVLEWEGLRYDLPGENPAHRLLTMSEVLYRSSNRGSAYLGVRLGRAGLHQAAVDFGFGRPTGLPLTAEVLSFGAGRTGEVAGVVHPIRRWDGKTITRMPIGHAVSATPLQVHQAMGVIANGGRWVAPRLVERVFNDAGETVWAFPAAESRQVVSPETAAVVAEMLSRVVLPKGTATRANEPGLKVAGKTGTSRKIDPDGTYSTQRHFASFTGFFPYDQPQVVITVIVNEPQMEKGAGAGGLVAAPAFRNLAIRTANYLGIPYAEPLVAQRP